MIVLVKFETSVKMHTQRGCRHNTGDNAFPFFCIFTLLCFIQYLPISLQSFCCNLEDLREKVNRLESENVKMREEFNVQRAKMKELFLQKEGRSN